MALKRCARRSGRCSATTSPSRDASATKSETCSTSLPERDRPPIKRRLIEAWQETDYLKALEQLRGLAVELEHEHPGAAASLREGMEETLTITRLGITGKLKRTLQSTNPCESMIGTVPAIQRNVKNCSSGEMCLRWTAAGMLQAESRFRKVEGYRGLAQLAVHVKAELTKRRHQLNTQLTPALDV